MTLAMCTVLSADIAPVSADRVAQAWAARWPDERAPAVADGDSLELAWHDRWVTVATMPVPMPGSELPEFCEHASLWPDAVADVARHRAHRIVVAGGERPFRALAESLTKATAVVLDADAGALGVRWTHGPVLASAPAFARLAATTTAEDPPLELWIDFRVWRLSNGRSAGFTSGLGAFGLLDFEAEESPETPAELRDRLRGLAGYALDNPRALRDGDTVGNDARERIRVRRAKSLLPREEPVLSLTYESGFDRPWWKPW